MVATANVLMSVEEFLATRFEVPAELMHGEVRSKAMPTFAHGMLQAWLAYLIIRDCKDFVPVTELHCRLDSASFRLLDVAVARRSEIQGRYAEKPVHLAIEVLSPQDTIVDLT
jgi:Uma2 family endonuclease